MKKGDKGDGNSIGCVQIIAALVLINLALIKLPLVTRLLNNPQFTGGTHAFKL